MLESLKGVLSCQRLAAATTKKSGYDRRNDYDRIKLTAPCSCPYTRHQQNPYPVPVRTGVDRRVTVAVVVTDKGSGYAKRYNRGKENKREEEGMRESNNTFRRHCGWL